MDINPKEREILNLLKTGMDQKDIAKKVLLSERGLKYYISAMLSRFNIQSKKVIELIAYAMENSLIEKNAQKCNDE